MAAKRFLSVGVMVCSDLGLRKDIGYLWGACVPICMWVCVHMSCVYTVVQYVGKCNFKDLHLYIDSLCIPDICAICTLFDPGVLEVKERVSALTFVGYAVQKS